MIAEVQTPISVLLIEDTPDVLELLKEVLKTAGFAVLTAENGEEAWEVLSTVRPDVVAPDIIITDLRLPKLNGLELIKRIKATPGLNQIPIIATTAEHETALERAKEFGANATLVKPIVTADLVELIPRLLQKD